MKAYFYYYCPTEDTHNKLIESCVKAGYGEFYAIKEHNHILGLDSIDGFTNINWRRLNALLPLCTKKLEYWLNLPDRNIKVKDIRENISLIRLIGDSVGKFVKKEMRINATKEEKHIYHHFETKTDEIKYYNELRSIANKQLKDLSSG